MSARRPAPSNSAPLRTAAARGLIVSDDLELRLKVADLLRRAGATRVFDGCAAEAFAAMPPAALGHFAAFFLILDFGGDCQADSLMALTRLHHQAPRIPIFVIARGGSERSAVRAVKAGAMDYWPIHAIELTELQDALNGIDAPAGGVPPVPRPAPSPSPSPSSGAPGAIDPLVVPGYRFIKRLSKSDAGAVFLAETHDSPALVAVKVQRMSDVTPAQVKRFMREYELLSQINHRSVADVVDFGVTAACCYLVLEYFPCGSLRDRLRHPIRETDALNYALQIGEGLCVVHAARIVHRDLKPSNLMLTDDNRVVMIDFGLARSNASALEVTHPSISIGSPYYVSPEQISGQEPDVRCDLYSFGVVLYELLTGHVPFAGTGLEAIIEQHRTAPVPRLPPPLQRYQRVLDRLLAKQPRDRYATAADVVADLRTLPTQPPPRSIDE